MLFLVSLVADKNHPLVAKVLAEVPRFEKTDPTGKYTLGRSDFSEHPVYQTKWLKYGLRSLGLPDPYAVPKVADSYGALFWMDYRAQDHRPDFRRKEISLPHTRHAAEAFLLLLEE